ncbi:MAG: oxygen-independent coproporphyrinogen III oxidase [Clostridia bacterium]|nr:oxygen-independent coproporphyrinogen III oxidase [Clostridia bacterium]NCC42448.1 oxygen-independent coproporphyrinogen III oxidase [Clostridia bacterium]
MKNRELELYVHIPFCAKKCDYCDFLSGPAGKEQQQDYVEALCREIDSCGDFSEYEVSSIFIGGGTPSLLDGNLIFKIMDRVRKKFAVADTAEISIEANPGTVDEGKLGFYRQAGINRISFGCQSADDTELKKLGRIHTWEKFLESFHMARKAGFDNINMDLMSGLPGQTLRSWEDTLGKAIALGTEHISAYSLIIEEGTPFASQQLELPDEETERLMYERTHEILETAGYHQYEISNYAKTGRECRHNIGYWKRTEYLGLGIGSASLVNETRFSNTQDMTVYLADSHKPEAIRENIEILDKNAQIEEYMILGLRMMSGISRKDFQERFQMEIDKIYGKIIEKYVAGGFMKWSGEYLCFTRKGISVSNPILAEFLLGK